MRVIKNYDSFDSSRYSDPWVAIANPVTKKPNFSKEVGGYTGGKRTGAAGKLYVDNPQDGAVYMYGQKDYRGKNTEKKYVQFLNGEFVPLQREKSTEVSAVNFSDADELEKIQKAVNKERIAENPVPIYPPAVKTNLYMHQIRGYNMALITLGWTEMQASGKPKIKTACDKDKNSKKGFGYLFEMGCGKTLTAIATIGTGFQFGYLKRVLVVAPSSVCSVWEREFQNYADFPFKIHTLLGDKSKRIKDIQSLENESEKSLCVAVINYESVWRDDIFTALLEYDADLIIADESQRIKNPNANQSKAMHKLGDRAQYKFILSGTPIQNEFVDLFSQYRFLDASIFGTKFYDFRDKYAVMGGYKNKEIVDYKNLDDLVKREMSVAYRVTKAEALDLPEQTFERRYVSLREKERRLYEQLRYESYAELENGERITAKSALTQLLRLQQFTGGFLPESSNAEPQLISKAKLNALEDILCDYVVDSKKKLVIFARFLPEIHEIERLCEKVLKKAKMRSVSIYGEVERSARGKIVEQFQTDPATMVIVGQIDTLGVGQTLTAADTCVYYSLNFNYATYDQSMSRIHRIGQKNTCTYIHLIAEDTIDEKVLEALSRKENLAKTIVDDWKKIFAH